MKSSVLTLRKPIPLARAIRWVPAGLFTPPRTLDDLALFITQSALRDVMRHLRSDPEQELLGFLLGELYECPETGARYVVINAAARTGHAIAESDRILIPEEEWLGVQLEVRRRRTQLVGWYHSAPFVGPHPARADLETHSALFTEPWQCGLVIATTGDAPTGAFFRSLLGERTGGGVLIPFYELADEDDPIPANGRKRTLIDWVNYETRGIVERDESERRPFVPSRPPTPRSSPVILSVPSAPEEDDDEEEDRIFSPPPATPPAPSPAAAEPAAAPPPAGQWAAGQPPLRESQPPTQPPGQSGQSGQSGQGASRPPAAATASPPVRQPPSQRPLSRQPPSQQPPSGQPQVGGPGEPAAGGGEPTVGEPVARPQARPPFQPARPAATSSSPSVIPLNPPPPETPFDPQAPAARSNGGDRVGNGAGGASVGGGGAGRGAARGGAGAGTTDAGYRPPPASAPGMPTAPGSGLVMLPSAAELQEMLTEPEPPEESGGGLGRGIRYFLVLATVAAVALVYLWNSGRLQLPGFLAGIPVLDSSVGAAAGAPGPQPTPATDPAALNAPVADSAGASLSLSDSTEVPSAGSTAVGGELNAPFTGPAAEPAPSTDPAVLHFTALADSLEDSIRNFQDRNGDFAVHRITCEGLAVGYRAADDAFIALASAHRAARDALDPARETRYRELVEQMGRVNEEFGVSKCPRP